MKRAYTDKEIIELIQSGIKEKANLGCKEFLKIAAKLKPWFKGKVKNEYRAMEIFGNARMRTWEKIKLRKLNYIEGKKIKDMLYKIGGDMASDYHRNGLKFSSPISQFLLEDFEGNSQELDEKLVRELFRKNKAHTLPDSTIILFTLEDSKGNPIDLEAFRMLKEKDTSLFLLKDPKGNSVELAPKSLRKLFRKNIRYRPTSSSSISPSLYTLTDSKGYLIGLDTEFTHKMLQQLCNFCRDLLHLRFFKGYQFTDMGNQFPRIKPPQLRRKHRKCLGKLGQIIQREIG